MHSAILTREQFRNAVFQRDGNKCVYCGKLGQDAHHIMERRLFHDGGYYLDNGSTLCGPCHVKAEQTLISTEEIRDAAGIKNVILPEHLYRDQWYDKWSNPILASGLRVRGELFEDPSVQKILEPVLHLFTNRVKYPRTYHLPWSPGVTNDDRMLSIQTVQNWNWEVVVTEKLDGENTSFYMDGLHARSLDYEPHPSRNIIKAIHASIAHNIPEGWRICCENVTAKHSIKYTNLKSYCHVFSIWDGCRCLSWDDTVTFAGVLGLEVVPVIYRGLIDPSYVTLTGKQWADRLDFSKQEGYVVRPTSDFQLREFSTKVGKYVRKRHVQTHGHWMRQKIEFNELETT